MRYNVIKIQSQKIFGKYYVSVEAHYNDILDNIKDKKTVSVSYNDEYFKQYGDLEIVTGGLEVVK